MQIHPMQKLKYLNKVLESGLVVVIRADSADQAVRIAAACAEGGVTAMEVTFTFTGAVQAIEELAKRHSAGDILVGAGTVLDPETTRHALLAGAKFIVSPCCNADVARMCRRYQVPYMPGAGTSQEVVSAMEDGADIVKLFPGEALGPSFVKALRGPLPHAPLMPTGGVSAENAAEWIKAGCVALGVGGNLTKGAKTGDYASITKLARQIVDNIAAARKEMAK
jgi:2-dehydro-3-deoxyphosphogluconate aldolase/(4S)-4-hydroxy-2-oxoglutarate aldolase